MVENLGSFTPPSPPLARGGVRVSPLLRGGVRVSPLLMVRVKVSIIPHLVACLYVMITGYSPRNLQGKDPFLAVLPTDAVPVRDRTYAISQPLATVIDRALIDNPKIYCKSAAKFKQALLIIIS